MSLITFPSVSAYSVDFRCQFVVAESTSPFTLSSQVYNWGSARWEGEITFETFAYSSPAEKAELRAFLMACNGKANTFNIGDPEYTTFGKRGVGTGTPLVNGGTQTGKSLITDGWTNSTTNIMRAGDMIQLGSGLTAQLYMLTADVNSNGSGQATLSLNRPLLSSPADNAAIVVNNPVGHFRLADNNIGWQGNPSGRSKIVIPIIEAI